MTKLKSEKKEDCIFCKIIEGKLPCHKIWENKEFLSFLDINPVNEGHTLLIPKKHYEKMEDCPQRIISNIFKQTQKLMKIIKESTNADYVAISVVGLDVPHFHIHIIPRYLNDGMNNFWPTKKYKEGKDIEIANKIRKNIEK